MAHRGVCSISRADTDVVVSSTADPCPMRGRSISRHSATVRSDRVNEIRGTIRCKGLNQLLLVEFKPEKVWQFRVTTSSHTQPADLTKQAPTSSGREIINTLVTYRETSGLIDSALTSDEQLEVEYEISL
jgi:hypothetical protein